MLRNTLGQATVEYILLFTFMAMIGLAVMKGLGSGLSTSVRSLGYALTQELTTGVCKTRCFYSGYKNEGPGSGAP